MKQLATIELLEKMMTHCPVTADVEAVNHLVAFLAGYLSDNQVGVKTHRSGDRSVLYAGSLEVSPDYLFNAHLDVVPAPAEMFRLQRRGNWLYGRGTHDCLGNCAMLANLLVALRGSTRLGVIFSTDEEMGGESTRVMVEEGYRAKRLVVVADGSGNSIVIAQKGVLVVKLVAEGKGCHAAEPWKGSNAIDLLVDGYIKIRDLFPAVQAGDEWHSTLAATVVGAGSVHNKVPDRAEITLNIRLTEGHGHRDVLRQLEERSGLKAEVEMQCPVVSCDRDHPEIRGLVAHMQRELGCDIAVKRSNGATDARHFVETGLPIAIIGIPGRDLHGADECLDATALARYETMLFSFMNSPREG